MPNYIYGIKIDVHAYVIVELRFNVKMTPDRGDAILNEKYPCIKRLQQS